MHRVVIFSHFDKENKIKDYIINYLFELAKISDDIIFVSDCNVSKNELKKIQKYITHSITGRHSEYDFGSYKRGYNYLSENNLLNNYNQMIFANDSCYAPLFSFNEMFSEMNLKNLDFWGVTANRTLHFGGIRHIQSYFLVFNKNVFTSQLFKSFMNSIINQKDKENIILKYECGLTEILEKAGYKWDVYCALSKKYQDSHILYFYELIKNNHSPFLKRKIPVLITPFIYRFWNLKFFINKYTKYNYNFINNQDCSTHCKEITKIIETLGKFIIKKYFLKRLY